MGCRSHTQASSRLISLHELVGLQRQCHPALCLGIECDPLLHEPPVTWIESLAFARAHNFIDPFLRELCNEFASRKHRKYFSLHRKDFLGADPPFSNPPPVPRERRDNRRKARRYLRRIPALHLLLRCTLLRCTFHPKFLSDLRRHLVKQLGGCDFKSSLSSPAFSPAVAC